MEATFLSTHPRLPNRPSLFNNPSNYQRKNGLFIKKFVVNAKQGKSDSDSHDCGKSTDQNMIVLKMRIKKMKALEIVSSNEGVPPSSDWKEWEKRIFTHYHEDVCEAIEMLQSYLMKTRPSVALGMLALVAMTVPLSSSFAMTNVLKLVKGLLAGCHVCIDIDF